jgi:hypothetical protein
VAIPDAKSGGEMRIIKPNAIEMREADRTRDEPAYMTEDTIEINLERFIQWYYDKWWRKDGGMISFKDVPALMTEFIKDMEVKQ